MDPAVPFANKQPRHDLKREDSRSFAFTVRYGQRARFDTDPIVETPMNARTTMTVFLAATAFAAAALADPPAGAQASQWNTFSGDKHSQSRNNCYNYAVDARNGKYAQPGRKAGATWSYPIGVPGTVIHVGATRAEAQNYKGAAADLAAFGAKVKAAAEADGLRSRAALNNVPAGHSAVALVVGYIPVGPAVRLPNGQWMQKQVLDYHWYRLNADGTWSHKPGPGKATTKDDAGNNIVNPQNLISANESKTRYDRFITIMSFQAGTIDPDFVDNWLVSTPEGVIRILASGSAGVKAGWCEGDRAIIRDLVQDYLVGLPAVAEPSTAWHGRLEGFQIEASPRCLTLNPSLWDRSDEVLITVRSGIIRVMRHTTSGQIIDNYYTDTFGLSAYLAEQSITRTIVDPCPGDSCYPDCDQSTGPGVLDIFDFLCFGNLFAAGDPYACDCDTTTGAGVCDIFDFLCFGNAFNVGCQ